jgi:aryl sulfotransferase
MISRSQLCPMLLIVSLLFFPQVKYIVVGRDARDVAMSMMMQALTLEAMRDRAKRLAPGRKVALKKGAKSFFFKGTNGRWKDVLSAEELRLYDETASRVLSPGC